VYGICFSASVVGGAKKSDSKRRRSFQNGVAVVFEGARGDDVVDEGTYVKFALLHHVIT
jgi:hypothetical protein